MTLPGNLQTDVGPPNWFGGSVRFGLRQLLSNWGCLLPGVGYYWGDVLAGLLMNVCAIAPLMDVHNQSKKLLTTPISMDYSIRRREKQSDDLIYIFPDTRLLEAC
jgi:hypothetical protein